MIAFLFSSIYLGWALGANDAANIFGTGVGSGILNYKIAIILTAAFVILGATAEGSKCMETVGHLTSLSLHTALLATLSAAITVTLLTYLKLPISTSQAIIGAISGIAFAGREIEAIFLDKLAKVILCWILTPLGALLISFFLYHFLSLLIRGRIRSLSTFNLIMRISLLTVGCYAAYSLGANNVANTTGAFVGAGLISPRQGSILGGVSIALGSLTFSRGVMLTVGRKITPLDPFSAFIAILAEALIIHLYTQIGVPVSSSQAIVGAVTGIGLAVGVRTVNRRMLLYILTGWLATLLLAAGFSLLLARIF